MWYVLFCIVVPYEADISEFLQYFFLCIFSMHFVLKFIFSARI